MQAKTFVGWRCLLVIAGFVLGCRPGTIENHKRAHDMQKLTIEQVQEKYQDQWMAVPGVIGVGIGAVANKPVIMVMVAKKAPEIRQKIPKTVEGYSVVIEETGEIRARE
jgi:hypothetical protein